MAFIIENFTYGRGTVNNYARTTSPAIHTYNTTEDDLAVVVASGYFDGVGPNVVVRDFIATNTANEPGFLTVTGLNPITTANILGILPPGSITTDEIADGAVTNPKLATDAVSTIKIVAEAVTTPKIADSAVTDIKLATDSVTTIKIPDGAVTNPKLATDSVSGDKIAAGGVSAGKYAAFSIVDGDISGSADVNGTKLADGTVPETKLDAAAQAKLGRIKASAIVTLTPGGAPPNSDTIAIPGKGIVATDIVQVTVKFPGLTPLQLAWAETQLDGIFVVMNGNIVGDEIVQYTIFSPIA